MIEFQNISKTYITNDREITAVDQVNLSIDRGEIFGVIGFSGAGKSTLIRCVNLLERPDIGKVLVNHNDLLSLSKRELIDVRRKIGMIFQHFNLLESKTVFHNVGFPLSLAGVPGTKVKQKVEELLEFVGLADKADHYPEQLSGGQKQRVGIARALATDPEILLCDEATSALDPQTTSSILDLLRKVRDEYHITILMITHEMQVIKEVCDRVAVMEEGKVIEEGSIFDVFSNPQQQTTKNFVKTVMNDELPQSVMDKVTRSQGNSAIYRLTFENDSTEMPLISEVAKRYDVHTNILFGQIVELQGRPFGNLVVELQGKSSEIQEAYQFIDSKVKVEEVTADGR
ncbi:methionine ABC transporter ATP-binding protein [Gracilibacillus caseinilyticus]|uniref:Methionine ABC transporter ATP-binding protein n=1 Tax=Gracilibacillus caseinilyticus TaxID=2932256 RepID=A0ABY4F2J9_9BACI|nr:methionine ABC transporter ATP-binding protein [Gracilibacillus caseinilyticus]UOQ50461.1 methionine ABC transporter ATP-binding protein [Gracilibacillus caseinilyticus]